VLCVRLTEQVRLSGRTLVSISKAENPRTGEPIGSHLLTDQRGASIRGGQAHGVAILTMEVDCHDKRSVLRVAISLMMSGMWSTKRKWPSPGISWSTAPGMQSA
jgi:hypothetical protein